MPEQFLLSFPKVHTQKKKQSRRNLLRLGVLKWLYETGAPDGVAFDVTTRLVGMKADLVASWHAPQRQKKLKMSLLVPQRIMMVLCAETRSECWPECAHPEEILKEIAKLRQEMQAVERDIRSAEPHLLDNNVLFEEFAVWNYGKSKNSVYQQLRGRLRSLESSLYKGTRLEKIARLGLADELYLAVPKNEIHPQELIPEWGLLAVAKDLQVEVLRLSERHSALPEARMHLIQNMLNASQGQNLQSQGFQVLNNGSIRFVSLPRCRKLPYSPEL
ncbi:MAG: hypothetical protein WCT05_05885 [Lentisphaeria bacterium]